jgi:polyphosphate glucokinase
MDAAHSQPTPHTLVVDIGGTGIKRIVVDAEGDAITERLRQLTPQPATPEAVLAVIGQLIDQTPRTYSRVSVGFPGVVRHGVTHTAPNLGTESWRGVELAEAISALAGAPTQVINDAELQGYGVIEGAGVELVLTLGTGLGSGLYTDGLLVPNLELGHHPFEKDRTYEERVSNAERQRVGNKKWRSRVMRALGVIQPIFNPDVIHLGGGNTKKIPREMLPEGVRIFANVEGMTGGVRLWQAQEHLG